MQNNSKITFIIVSGIIVLTIFLIVLSINLVPNYESNSYFVNIEDKMSAKIESANINNNKLTITTSNSPIEYCIKTTRTKPSSNALCWNKIENNVATINILQNKKYYIWLKDKEGNISNYSIVSSKE